jgi:hypothetical protein
MESEILEESASPDPEYLELFNRVFVSTAFAARKMPRFITFEYTTGFDLDIDYPIFKFSNNRATRTVPAAWISVTGYKPGSRVANAWGFR